MGEIVHLKSGEQIELENVRCALCGSHNSRFVYALADERFNISDHKFRLVKCAECDLVYLNPRPSAADIQYFYPRQFFSENSIESKSKKFQEEFLKLKSRNGSLLDVGCRNGAFVEYARRHGFDAEGLENAVEAQNPWGINIYKSFDEVASNTYDVVTAWAVFEHLHDPASYFDHVSRVLKPGGEFVFLVPNFLSFLANQMMFEDVPRHLYFYTPKSVERFLAQAGLECEEIEQDNRIYYGGHRKLLVYFGVKMLGSPFHRVYFKNLWACYKTGEISLFELIWLTPFEHVDRMVHRYITKYLSYLGRNGTIVVHARKPD